VSQIHYQDPSLLDGLRADEWRERRLDEGEAQQYVPGFGRNP
jgi:hypothetical protein